MNNAAAWWYFQSGIILYLAGVVLYLGGYFHGRRDGRRDGVRRE